MVWGLTNAIKNTQKYFHNEQLFHLPLHIADHLILKYMIRVEGSLVVYIHIYEFLQDTANMYLQAVWT